MALISRLPGKAKTSPPSPAFHHVKSNLFSRIAYYSTTHTSDTVYIIGGVVTENLVAEFYNNQWRRLGGLNKGRYRHGSISIGSETMIIGGATE